ncbi:MAG TPA: hypothetical protein VK817_17365 [Trebonia sp.]|jgi:hypothetical protein|nr:hypothetical protein [Trebonia sp.]
MAQPLPFTETDLKAAAGPSSFDLGLALLHEVADLEIDDREITATVSGEYAVSLTVEVGPRSGIVTLEADCPCPAGQEDSFCEHCVAVGVAALRTSPEADASTDHDLIRSWLTALTKDELAAEILELADGDENLGRRLSLKAAVRITDSGRMRPGRIEPEQIGMAVRQLLNPPGRITREYADSVYRAANAIDALIDGYGDADAIGLARSAFTWVKEAHARADDGSTLIAEAARELLAAHLRACEAADPAPDPVALGTYLADLIVYDTFGVTPNLEEYASLLGRAGALAIRDRIKAVHQAEPGNRNATHLAESMPTAEGAQDNATDAG